MVTMHIGRYREIAETLARHGLGYMLEATGLGRPSPDTPAAAPRQPQPVAARHLREALEELGPTFVKFGQLLSTRPDLLPEPYIVELVKLQDSAPSVTIAVVEETIRNELGQDPSECFAWFDSAPLASASIGQAHAARRPDGTEVVVKVRRPDAVAQVHEDLDILRTLAERATRTWDFARRLDLNGVIREFSQTLLAELDYLHEARNAERFAANFAHRPDAIVPRIFWDTTTARVLTLERLRGLKITDVDALDSAGIDRVRLAQTGSRIMLQMIFEDRFFHADPHPGNLLVQPDGSIGLIDFGMVGELREELADALTDFLVAFTLRSAEGLVDAVLDLSVVRAAVDHDELRAAMTSFIADYEGHSLRELGFARLVSRMLGILREQGLRLPREVPLVLKVLITVEGIGLQLDPEFDIFGVLTPYVQRILHRRLTMTSISRRLIQAASDGGELLLELPVRLRRILDAADRTGFDVHLRAAELEPLMRRTERVGNRLVAGIIAAALIMGIGEVVPTEERWRSSKRGLLGAGAAVIGSLAGYLILTARRRGR
ncbi:MAG TPA: AarF/ABC1/UbiB kinase family protein [Microbacterium sp.]|uniref:ABC1 kinase family protein n=1 Tax=Microbacterium sp. TaxID=51671 RepID=UPI002B466CA2|nr:AarF/ABC1/UbiB kinase family protein [Microbacterium sp.]HKT56657.1 AarF/ABC1/UbiB kinase family protein [Microbacterium sp.]